MDKKEWSRKRTSSASSYPEGRTEGNLNDITGKRPFGKPRHRRKNNTDMDFKDICLGNVNYTDVAQFSCRTFGFCHQRVSLVASFLGY
jgi:hypothetical protein